MKRYSNDEITKVKTLRHEGKTILEIMELTGMPKTTIWHHIQTVVLSPYLISKIDSRRGGSVERKQREIDRANEQAMVLLSSGKDIRELCILVSMLYWAEGSKREFVFTNTDISMIKLYLKFLLEILKIPKKDIHLLIRISDPIDPHIARSFWKLGTGILEKNITINHNNIQNKTKTQHGICRVSTSKSGYYLKVIRCIIGLVQNEFSPCIATMQGPHSQNA